MRGENIAQLHPVELHAEHGRDPLKRGIERHQGFLYNFYDTTTLERTSNFISFVDAAWLTAGLIVVRKPGKLPYHTDRVTYQLEYGQDSLEMHKDAVRPGQRVVIVDDLLATGGTASAAARLVEGQGGVVQEHAFVIELGFLNGRQKLSPQPVHSLLVY